MVQEGSEKRAMSQPPMAATLGAGPPSTDPFSVGPLSVALQEWTQLLGSSFVVRDGGTLRAAESATFATAQRIPVILRPADQKQVAELVRIANRTRTPLYPVSSGKKLGLWLECPGRRRLCSG